MLRPHLLHDIEPGKRPDPVVIPALEPGKLQVRPVLRVLLDEVRILLPRERTDPAPVGPKHRNGPLVGRVETVPGHTQEPGLHSADTGIDAVEETTCEVPPLTGDCERLIGHGDQFGPLPLSERRRHPPGERVCRVDGFSADRLSQALAELPDRYSLLRDLGRMTGKPDDVALLCWRVVAQNEIRRRKHEEVEGVGVDELPDIKEFSELLTGRGRLDAEDLVGRFRRRQVVCRWAYTADPWRDPGSLLDRRPDEELLKPPEFHDLEVGRVNLPLFVEEDLYTGVTLDPGHRAYRDLFHLPLSFTRSRIFDVSLSSMIRLPMVKAYIV